jgi:hypothetical protein
MADSSENFVKAIGDKVRGFGRHPASNLCRRELHLCRRTTRGRISLHLIPEREAATSNGDGAPHLDGHSQV